MSEYDMKYVAFLDILGFKEKLRSMSHESAKRFIGEFSSTIYNSWKSNIEYEKHLEGYIVSDSFIISTKKVSIEALGLLIKAITDVCQCQFLDHGVILRGGIAKGEYNKLKAKELKNLQKGLIVGKAYIDAYLLEGTVKTIGVVVSKEVYEDVLSSDAIANGRIVEESIGGEKRFILCSFSLDFFKKAENLEKYVSLAISAEWLPHYYNALYFSMKNEKANRVNPVFANIFELLAGKAYSDNWRNIDRFIKNAFAESVFHDFQTRFLTYLRSRVYYDKGEGM